MVGRPRGDVIDESEVGVYHVFSRCVRRAFLCGVDPVSGKDYSHRRDWIEQRIEFLCGSFAIEACSYAILSNHYHLLMRNRPDLAGAWSDEEVVRRWWRLNPRRFNRSRSNQSDEPTRLQINSRLAMDGWVEERRKRLASPSWYMQYLNQTIARRANREDGLKGHYFADRFGARRMDSEIDSLVCSIYLDLNELRAGLSDRLENSTHSSICRRLARLKRGEQALLWGDFEKAACYAPDDPDYWLCPIDEEDRAPPLADFDRRPGELEDTEQTATAPTDCDRKRSGAKQARARLRHGFLPITLKGYVRLVDVSARRFVAGKQRMDPTLPPILERLGVTRDGWLTLLDGVSDWFRGVLGPLDVFEQDAGKRAARVEVNETGFS